MINQELTKIKTTLKKCPWLQLGFIFCISWFSLIIIECSQKSFVDALLFCIQEPMAFLLNFSLLLLFSCLALLFKRVIFSCVLINSTFILLSVVNLVLYSNRGTPFMFSDLFVIQDGLAVIQEYLSLNTLLIIVSALLLLLLFLIFLYKKIRVSSFPFKNRAFTWLISLGIALLVGSYAFTHYGFLVSKWDIQWDFKRNGFLTSFVNSYVSSYIQAPKNYDEENIERILGSLKADNQKEDLPNILFLQLESICDITSLPNILMDGDPLINIKQYYQNNLHGVLSVPTYGGTTTRTEFEALTSYNLDFMGNGAIPFNNGVLNKPVASIAYTLNSLGYTSTAIHNYQGDFYNRNVVYPNLGFNYFISLEMMNNVKQDAYWPSDDILPEYINETMLNTEGSDFIFTVAVSNHGTYPDYLMNETHEVNVLEASSKESLIELQNYVDLASATDKVVKEIVESVMNNSEHTILVVYSDHLPKLMEHNQMKGENLYETFYFMIDNRTINQKSQLDLQSYQLASLTLNQARLPRNVMEQFHINNFKIESYLDDLQLLQYDQLYGGEISGKNDLESMNMTMGIAPIQIHTLYKDSDSYIIKGDNFTPFSVIYFDNQRQKTNFEDKNTLRVKTDFKAFKEIQVKQIGGRYNTTYAVSNKLVNN